MASPPPHRRTDHAPGMGASGTRIGRLRALAASSPLLSVLPRGRTLPEATWARRHRGLWLLLAAHALALPLAGLAMGVRVDHLLLDAAGLLGLLVVARMVRPRWAQAGAVAIGLTICSALVVQLSGGALEAHFHYFLVVGALMLYQSWWPALVAIAFSVLQHGLVGSVLPAVVYGTNVEAARQPWRWALVHGAFLLAAAGTHLVAWRINDQDHAAVTARLQRYARRMRIVLDATAEAVIGVDDEGRVTFANRAAGAVLDQPADELVDARLHDLLHGAVGCEGSCQLSGVLAGASVDPSPEALRRFDERIVLADGTAKQLEGSLRPVRRMTRRTALVVTFRDVTAEREEAAALAEAQERFSVAFDAAPIGMAILDGNGRHLQVNRVYCELTGHSREHLLSRPVLFTHPEDRPALERADAELLAGRVTSSALEHRLLRADGDLRWVRRSTAVLGRAPSPTFIIQLEDVTEHRRTLELLDHRALHDSLTGLPNRRLLVDRLDQSLAARRRMWALSEASGAVPTEADTEHVALLFIDLDRFKHLNDNLGHELGDRVLLAVANRIRTALADGDTAARLGGDEFVVLCPAVTREGAEVRANVLHAAIGERLEVADHDVRVTASIGVVLADGAASAEDLLRDADVAMSAAKERGRSRTEHFDAALRERAEERFHLEANLATAIERGEIILRYMPTVDLRTGEVEGAEALVRWAHPDLGELQPSVFLPIAEETGLIVPLGLWVLQEAIAQAAAWQRAEHRDLVVAVNLSARQLAQPGLADVIGRLLRAHDLAPSSLRLEITESILLDAGAETTPNLFALKDLGVAIGIDDFGTGYSSLTYLKRFPVDFIKIDRAFVDGLGRDREDTAIVQAVIALGRALGLAVIGEGIEQPLHADLLRDLGCQYGQGYLYGRPQEAASITDGLVLDGARVEVGRSARSAGLRPPPTER